MLFFAALGIIEWIALSVFFLALLVGVSWDRRGRDEPKWYVFGLGFALLIAYFWNSSSFVFFGQPGDGQIVLWEAVRTWEFWTPVAYYVGAGLVYSLIEFGLALRKSVRKHSTSWAAHLAETQNVPVFDGDGQQKMMNVKDRHSGRMVEAPMTRDVTTKEIYDAARSANPPEQMVKLADRATSGYISHSSSYGELFQVTTNDGGLSIEPKVDREELADSIAAWTTLWPAYAVSLILGDLLLELARTVADFLATISGRLVKVSFANVFKF